MFSEGDKVQVITKSGLNVVGELERFEEGDTYYRLSYPVAFDFVIQKLPDSERIANVPMIKPLLIGDNPTMSIKIDEVLYIAKVIDQMVINAHNDYKNAYIRWSSGLNIAKSEEDIKKLQEAQELKVIKGEK